MKLYLYFCISFAMLSTGGLAQDYRDLEYYTTGNAYNDPVDPQRPECRWLLPEQTIGEFLRQRPDSRYFVAGLDAVDLASSTIDDPSVNITVLVARDIYFAPGSSFDILDLLADESRFLNVLARHISLTALTASVAEGRQDQQELRMLDGTAFSFFAGVSSMLRQSYYMNGRFFDYEGGICFSNGIVFFPHTQVLDTFE